MASYRTPLSRARGLGAAGHGVTHWVGERVGAIAPTRSEIQWPTPCLAAPRPRARDRGVR